MKREWLLLLASVVATVLIALGLTRLLAPGLLGVRAPIDRRVVRLSREVPPFFDNAFASGETKAGTDHMVNDPLVGHRRRGLVPEYDEGAGAGDAPFDLLGFRNRSVPVVADVVAIGDSQTVGVNAPIDANWPGALRSRLTAKAPVVYNMSVGGWGAVQYLGLFDKALRLRPRVVVVAYYTGNDPADSLYMAYAFDAWSSLRGPARQPESAPAHWPPKPEEAWFADLPDGRRTIFTPLSRLGSNDRRYPGTAEGYRIMLEAARRMARAAAEAGVGLVFTVIPTKELVFAPVLRREGMEARADYARLVADEAAHIDAFAASLGALPDATYVDVTGPLQQAALAGGSIYPESSNGHPLPEGYAVIAAALAPVVGPMLPDPVPQGPVRVGDPDAPDRFDTYLVRAGEAWRFAGPEVYRASGWAVDPEDLPVRPRRDLAHLRNRGTIMAPDPKRFGPVPSPP